MVHFRFDLSCLVAVAFCEKKKRHFGAKRNKNVGRVRSADGRVIICQNE